MGIEAAGRSHHAGDEPHLLLAAASFAGGGGAGLGNEYAARTYAPWVEGRLRTDGSVVGGRLVEPHGIGFPLLIAPAYALGGAKAVEVMMAMVAALAFVLAAALARRVVPDPWASSAALVAGLSPPALAAATAVDPGLTGGALLVGASLCALAVRERPLMRTAFGGAAMLAVLPWLDPWLLVPAAPVAALLARWTARRSRGVVALGTVEIQLASLIFYVSLNARLYGGFTPLAVAEEPVTGVSSFAGHAERVERLGALFLDRDVGLLRWAPVFALAFAGAWLLGRSRRERLARLVPERRDAEHAAFLALSVCAAQVVVAAFTSRALEGPWFPGAQLVPALPCAVALIAWGLRHAAWLGRLLAALTLLGSAWLIVEGVEWAAASSDAPWGPLVDVFPRNAWVSSAVCVALVVVAVGVAEWRRRRQLRL